MNDWKLIDTAKIPGTEGKLQFHQRENDFSISIVDGATLMNTWAHGSEDALAKFACTKVADRPTPRVLIGGLGMGFTLAAALGYMGDTAEVVVAELVPEVVKWNRGPLGEHSGNPLQDARTTVCEGDVAKVIRSKKRAFDAIMLDVDNGPEGLTRKKNDWLYDVDGLTASYEALRPKGLLAIWSATSDKRFTERLRKVGFTVSKHRVHEHEKEGKLHCIWLCERE